IAAATLRVGSCPSISLGSIAVSVTLAPRAKAAWARILELLIKLKSVTIRTSSPGLIDAHTLTTVSAFRFISISRNSVTASEVGRSHSVLKFGVGDVPQAIPQRVDPQNHEHNREARRQREPWRDGDPVDALPDHI